MLRIFNTNSLGQKQRFYKAIAYGIPTAIILAITFSFVQKILMLRLSILYLVIGYAIAYVIRKQGRGVQPKFALLGATLTLLCMLFGDLLTFYGLLVFKDITLLSTGTILILRSWFSPNLNNLLSLAFRAYAVYYSFMNSRIV